MTTSIPRDVDLGALAALPRDGEGPVFGAPWEAQAFAMTLSLHARGVFAWREWADALAAALAAAAARGEPDDGSHYYEHWLSALEHLVDAKKLIPAHELGRRADEWDAAARATPHGKPVELRRLDAWPDLPLKAWGETYTTLHLWTQIVGKVRLSQTPWMNHSWHVTLYVTARGLGTSPIAHGTRTFQIDFDFVDHQLRVLTSEGRSDGFALQPQTVAAFYTQLMQTMGKLGLHVKIQRKPNEVAEPIRFDRDETHRAYDREYANRFWRILVQSDRVFKQFRARFTGKCSPVHFFWGAPDLAVTRFSGRSAPQHPGGIPNLPDWVAREAYSHEVSSCGFWPGGGAFPDAAFYSYAYPEPAGFPQAPVKPASAFYNTDLREFILPYQAVRLSQSPDDALLAFLQTTYEAAADLGNWDRGSLEVSAGAARTQSPA